MWFAACAMLGTLVSPAIGLGMMAGGGTLAAPLPPPAAVAAGAVLAGLGIQKATTCGPSWTTQLVATFGAGVGWGGVTAGMAIWIGNAS